MKMASNSFFDYLTSKMTFLVALLFFTSVFPCETISKVMLFETKTQNVAFLWQLWIKTLIETRRERQPSWATRKVRSIYLNEEALTF